MPPLLRLSPKQIILLGVVLMLIGLVLSWLMVLDLATTSFFLAFVAFFTSTAGLMIGVIGLAFYGMERNRRNKDPDEPSMFDFDR